MAPLLGPTKLWDSQEQPVSQALYACNDSISHWKHQLIFLARLPPTHRLDSTVVKQKWGVTVSRAKLTDGSSHSCPELRVRAGGLGFKGERGGNTDGICPLSGGRRRDSVQRQSGWSASISEGKSSLTCPFCGPTLYDLRALHYEAWWECCALVRQCQ